MAQGIGSARIAQMVLFWMLVLHCNMAYANTFTVGDAGGWTFNIVNWPKGKSFKAGDTLVFNYAVGAHNVVVVNQAGYNTCITPPGSKTYQSGHDQVQLVRGWNYFICNYPNHCQIGMKISVYAM